MPDTKHCSPARRLISAAASNVSSAEVEVSKKTAIMVACSPSVLGMAATRINYDMLTYLPGDIETMVGQKTAIMVACSELKIS